MSWVSSPPDMPKDNDRWAALPTISPMLVHYCGPRTLKLFSVSSIGFWCSRCARAPCTCGLCAGKVITSESITREIMQLTGLPEEDVLFWSHDNTALTHIPYMICLDRWPPGVLHPTLPCPASLPACLPAWLTKESCCVSIAHQCSV